MDLPTKPLTKPLVHVEDQFRSTPFPSRRFRRVQNGPTTFGKAIRYAILAVVACASWMSFETCVDKARIRRYEFCRQTDSAYCDHYADWFEWHYRKY